jgi:hypothetical protein
MKRVKLVAAPDSNPARKLSVSAFSAYWPCIACKWLSSASSNRGEWLLEGCGFQLCSSLIEWKGDCLHIKQTTQLGRNNFGELTDSNHLLVTVKIERDTDKKQNMSNWENSQTFSETFQIEVTLMLRIIYSRIYFYPVCQEQINDTATDTLTKWLMKLACHSTVD